MHIVFQVLNFIANPNSEKFQLFPVDKLLLLMLAKHHGPKGIYPSQDSLAEEVQISVRYVRERIQYLVSVRLISIQKIRRKYHYSLLFLEDIPEPGFLCSNVDSGTPVPKIAEPQFRNSGTPVPTINTDDQSKLSIKKKKCAQSAPSFFVLPDWLDKILWEKLEQHMKSLGHPMTASAKELIIKDLEKFKEAGHDIEDIVDTSIKRGWKGLFAPNKQQTKINDSVQSKSEIKSTVPDWVPVPREPEKTEEEKKRSDDIRIENMKAAWKSLGARR